MTSEAKMSDDKAQRSMIDAARLADELRAEQEAAMMLERWALSSDIFASEVISSRSCPRALSSCSHLDLAPLMAWFWQVWSESVSLVSASSCSIIRLFTLGFSTTDGLVLASLVRKCFIGVSKFLFNHTPVPVSLFKESAGFFKCILVCIAPAISSNEVILSNGLSSIFFFKFGLDISESLLNKLDV